jgi:hypothetical protein
LTGGVVTAGFWAQAAEPATTRKNAEGILRIKFMGGM